MGLVAPVEDGKIVTTTSQSSLAEAASSGSSIDKNTFLKLLVAQMKYQDPLEPTSNTEFISQYAQFSQVEALNNMSTASDMQRASALVGQEVYVKVRTSSGDTTLVQGKVDYVVFENGKAFLSINENLYSLDDLDTVVDSTYMAAYKKAFDFVVELNKLPNVNAIDTGNADKIDELAELYNNMNEYEKSFIASDVKDSLEKYIQKLAELRLKEESTNPNTDETGDTDETGEVKEE